MEELKIPKKRGRRPKYLSIKLKEEEQKNNIENNMNVNKTDNNIKEEVVVVKKKRGRKPKNMHIIKQITDTSNIYSSIVIKDLLILHIPVNLEKMKKIEMNENYNIDNTINELTDLSGNIEYKELLDDAISQINNNTDEITPFDPTNNLHYTDLLRDESNINSNEEKKTKELEDDNEEKMNINKDVIIPFKLKDINTLCFWDLHTYDNTSYILPISNNKSIGHFCSLECAAAYNFLEMNDSNCWERYSLLHYVYNIDYKIKVAPSRILLNIFGGPLNIEEYRDLYNEKRTNTHININIPPLTNIDMQLDISNNKLNMNNNFVPLTSKRLDEAHINLNKLTICNKDVNTLDKCINLISNNK
jgi:hypothetical protein